MGPLLLCLFMLSTCTALDGTNYFTTHSFLEAIPSNNVTFEDPQVKEFHFHVYFYQSNPVSVQAALTLRALILEQVSTKEMIVVCNGVTEEMLPGLDTSKIPLFNTKPMGPHPMGSFEVWCPQEYFAKAMSFFMLKRGELSILIHPLSRHEIEDHTNRAMWLGPSTRIDLTVLEPDLGIIEIG